MMNKEADKIMTIAGTDAGVRECTGRIGRNRPEGYVEVRDPDSDKLLFEISPERALIRVRRRWKVVIFNLASVGLKYVGNENMGSVPCVVDKRHLTS